MSCGRIALTRAGIGVEIYYASEIDAPAIKVSSANYPCIHHMGDVTQWREWDIDWGSIDLLIAGSPCQGFSFAGKQLAFDDPRSALFFVFVDILNHIKSLNPDVKFLLENVRMKKEHVDVISQYTRVQPLAFNSDLVSAQSRPRLYWFNWDAELPEDKGITLQCAAGRVVGRRLHPETGKRRDNDRDIPIVQRIELKEGGKSPCLTTVKKDCVAILELDSDRVNSEGWHKWFSKNSEFQLKKGYVHVMNEAPKAACMTARQVASWNGNVYSVGNGKYRFLTPVEAERLQTVPDNYTQCVSDTQRYKMLGNGWTVDAVAHLLGSMPL